MGWQPIETAPDTQKGCILLYCPGGEGVTFGFRSHPSGAWWGWHHDYLDIQPTHWMPLPEAP